MIQLSKKNVLVSASIVLGLMTASTPAIAMPIQLAYHGEFQTIRTASVWNLFVIGYRVTPQLSVELQGQSTMQVTGGADWTTGNPRLGVSSLLISNSRWLLFANLNSEIPLTTASRSAGIGLAPGSYQALYYYVRGTHLSLGAENWIRYYAHENSATNGTAFYNVYGNVSPVAAYGLASTLYAETRVSINYFHVDGWGWRKIHGEDVSFQPGLLWYPWPTLNLRPYVSLPSNNITAQGVSAGLWLTWGF